VGVTTACEIVQSTIRAIVAVLGPEYLRMPSTEEEWNGISQKFYSEWNFPNCFGALDGKHVIMYPPRNSGSTYYNYKEGFSIVLLGLVDADYKFIALDIGANGRCSDSGIWENSEVRKAIDDKRVSLPAPQILPNSEYVSPFVIVADSGFGLKNSVMRPYPEKNITKEERIFNYR
jgi:hypothetical protein